MELTAPRNFCNCTSGASRATVGVAIKSDVGVPVFSTTAALIGGASEYRPRTMLATTAVVFSCSSEPGLASGKPSAELMPLEAAGLDQFLPPV